MYKKNFVFLTLFSLIVNCVNVSAYQYNQNVLFSGIKNFLVKVFLPYGEFNWSLMITISIFIVFAYMFSDALLTYSPMSRRASIAVGVLFAVIALSTGFIKDLANFLVGITESFGHWGTIIALIIIVVVYFVWRIISGILINFSKKK